MEPVLGRAGLRRSKLGRRAGVLVVVFASAILTLVMVGGCGRENGAGQTGDSSQGGDHGSGIDTTAVLRAAATSRALAIEAPGTLTAQIDSMPAGAMGRDATEAKQRELAWAAFFRGTLIKLGRVNSPSPLTLYFNPLFDVGVMQRCEASGPGGAVSCKLLCAIPGEALTGTAPTPIPPWIGEADPLAALTRIAGTRTAAFARAHPADARTAADPSTEHCSSANQAIAEVRLMEGLRALADVDPAALGQAIGDFLSKAGNTPGAASASDAELRNLLSNLSSLSLSGTVALSDRGWVLFFTPKASGWRQVALVVGPAGKGGLKLEAAKVITLRSEAQS